MTTLRCPTCRTEFASDADGSVFPFCSQRCKLADLGSWLDGRYVVHETTSTPEALGADDELLELAAALAARRSSS